ncbi:MAG TPA: NADH-quinone oxidoreductase subunit J, partial [Fimbriimonadaceae bacterium]|nr:NADH-quinone oxidoreductase subunit J [Fimbriimonadaceae bacterium]
MELGSIDPKLIVFGVLAAVAAVTAVGVVAFGNPVRSALCLIVNFFTLAFLYFTLNAELLGITQIIVYTGAIMVLFLFVIMLLNLGAPDLLRESRDPKRIFGFVFGAGLFAVILSQVVLPLQGVAGTPAPDGYGAPQPLG